MYTFTSTDPLREEFERLAQLVSSLLPGAEIYQPTSRYLPAVAALRTVLDYAPVLFPMLRRLSVSHSVLALLQPSNDKEVYVLFYDKMSYVKYRSRVKLAFTVDEDGIILVRPYVADENVRAILDLGESPRGSILILSKPVLHPIAIESVEYFSTTAGWNYEEPLPRFLAPAVLKALRIHYRSYLKLLEDLIKKYFEYYIHYAKKVPRV